MKLAAQLVGSIDLIRTPGVFIYYSNPTCSHAGIFYRCPCCGDMRTVPIAEKPTKKNQWKWNGNIKKPTLSPSIRHLDKCKWHGFLRKGIWTNA